MKNSKIIILLCISTLLMLLSCGKEDPVKGFVSFTDKPFTCCTEFTASASLGDSVGENITRGWEGEVPSGAENLPVHYPLDEIFLVVKSSANNYETLSFPVYDIDEGKRVFDICFRAEGDKLWAISGESSILVADGNSFDCNFYSTDKLHTSMEIGSAKTPNSKETYDPYGDKLFKSGTLSFYANGNQIYVGNPQNQNGTPLQNFSLTVNRITNVLIPRFIICDNLDENNFFFNFTQEQFEDSTKTSVNDWEIRAFIAGNDEAGEPYRNGFPVEYSFETGTNESGERGIISISKEKVEFAAGVSHAFITASGQVAAYQGVGFHNSSAPYLLPAHTVEKADICFTIYYNGNEPNIKKFNTFRIEALSDLVEGQLKTVTIIIDINDFINAFKIKSGRSNSAVKTKFDSAFGEVTEIPYKIITE